MSQPNPLVMTKFTQKRTAPVVLAVTEPNSPGKTVVTLGTIPLTEGVIKAKQVQSGMVVRAWLHGKPCGGERIVSTVHTDKETGMVTIEFSSPHPTTEYKAAYRFFVKNLIVDEPALVAHEEA